MSRFAQRSSQTELIDEPGIPFADWELCLRELNTVNAYLGGHAITLEGVATLLRSEQLVSHRAVTICEIGCGGGDNLKAIYEWEQRTNHTFRFEYIGIDINKPCTDFAARNCKGLNASFICSDYRQVKFGEKKPDIIFNSLFCHHFTNEQLVEMLRWMKSNSTVGLFINDLQRHPVAFYSIKMLTKLFSKSYLVKHDASISVRRGFHRAEWQQLLHLAGIRHYEIKWRWAFRYLVMVRS